MKEERGPWYLLTGVLIGIVLGLAYAWTMQPVEYVDTHPASLRSDFKDQYRALIAAAYSANQDIVRARARLDLLRDPDVFRSLSEQAQRTLAQGSNPDEARSLGLLAIALGQEAPGPAVVITLPSPTSSNTPTLTESPTLEPSATSTQTATQEPTATETHTPSASESSNPAPTQTPTASPTPDISATPTLTPRPRPTFTPTLSRTPTATPGGPFSLLSQEKICTSPLDAPLIQIEAVNAFGDPVPGVLVTVTWDTGQERFYTGLKPEKGLGYADFTATPGIIYSVQLDESGEMATGITAASCSGSGGATFWGAWLLKFTQS